MPLVNLVQERQQATRRNEGQARLLFFAFAGVAVLSLFGFGTLTLSAERVNHSAAEVQVQLAKLAPEQRKVEANERDIKNLQPRLETLMEAQAMTDKWNRILTHFVTETPAGTWLTAIHGSCQDPKKPVTVNLVGKGAEQRTIADFMLRAQAAEDLENVSLKFTEQRLQDSDAVDFELDADVKGTTPPPPPKKDDSSSNGGKA